MSEHAAMDFVTEESEPATPMMNLLDEHETHGEPPASDQSSDWLDRTFQSRKKRKRARYEVHQTDCPFGVLLMGILIIGIQLVSALLAVISMVRGVATPELWGRFAGSLIGLGIAWGYLSGHKAALRLYQFFGGIQIVGLVTASIAFREIEPFVSVILALVAAVGVGIYFYNFSPAVESYFRGEPVRYSFYLISWHFIVPLSVCVVGIMGGYGASIAVQEALEQRRWALNADPSQVAVLTVTNVADQNTQQQVQSRIRQLVGSTAQMKSEWNASRQRLRMAVAPVADVSSFSQRVDFGTVKTVKGRVIEIEVDPAAVAAIAKTEEDRRQEQARQVTERIVASRAEHEKRVEENKQRFEEVRARNAEDAAAREKAWKEREKKFWEKASGPGWVLEEKPGSGVLFTHRHLGYRVVLPVFWEINATVNTVPTVSPSAGRESVFGFAQSHSRSNELRAILRIETYAAEGDEKPIDVVKKWDKSKRGGSSYKRSGAFQEQKLGDLPCAGMAYSWKDQKSDAEFEVWVVRRNQTIYAVTIGANRRELNWSWSVDELRKAIQSFELVEPVPDEPETKSDSSETKAATSASATRRQLKQYPIEIALPPNAVRVQADTSLREGVKLSCSWARRWYNVTVLVVHDDGIVRIHWDDFGSTWDCDISRDCLIIDKKSL